MFPVAESKYTTLILVKQVNFESFFEACVQQKRFLYSRRADSKYTLINFMKQVYFESFLKISTRSKSISVLAGQILNIR